MPNLKEHNGDSQHHNQRIAILPESHLTINPDSDTKPHFVQLRHPRTDEAAVYLFTADDGEVSEVLNFTEEQRSWFIQNTVQSDGSLLVPTPVDPVYLVLPYLIKAQAGKFMQLDQIVTDEDFPECRRLCSCHGVSHLENIAEVKGPDDFRVYRYDKDKALSWLRLKVERVAEELRSEQIQTAGGAHVSIYVKSNKSTGNSHEDDLRFAHGLVAEYLPPTLGAELKEFLGVTDPVQHEKPDVENEPKAKRAKTDEGPSEDYSKNNNDGNSKKNAGKLTIAQKKLSQVDKSGMKSMASFFSPKPKK